MMDRHTERTVDRRSRDYLSLQEATRLVEKCSRQGVAVIGIDFVHIREGKVQPRIPINSTDWSAFLKGPYWQDIVVRCSTASLRVLEREKREDPEQLCSFVFFSEEEWTTGNRSH